MKTPRPQAVGGIPEGVFAATITPRRDGEMEVDLGAMLETIDFAASRGASGVLLFGATGEFLHFTSEERGRYVGLATKRSRVPVLANVSHSTLDGTIAMAEEAAGTGVAGVLAMPPYFYRYDADSLRSYYLELGSQAAQWTPVYLYNVPAFTSGIPLDTAVELLRSGLFAGIVDAGGDWSYLERLVRLGGEIPVTVMCGDDRLHSCARQAGARASVSPAAGAVPELAAALDRAMSGNDTATAARLQFRVDEFVSWIERFPAPVGIREAAALRGVKTGGPAVPVGEAGLSNLEDFRGWFKDWIRMVERECKADTIRLP